MNTNNFFEKVPYNNRSFPIYIGKGFSPFFPDEKSHNNWHEDIEFVGILSGDICYNINGKVITLKEGDGLFINSRQIHYNFSKDNSGCVFICMAFQPMLLCHSKKTEEKYITPILTNPALPYYVFHSDTEWERSVIENILKIYECQEEEYFELKLHSLFFEIWAEIYAHLSNRKKSAPSQNHDISALKDMLSYIQLHHKEKITLYDIANSAGICKTSCHTIFKKYTGRTPVEYLNYYRLQKSIELIKASDMTLTQICYEAGFSGASYYSECFRKSFGCSPSEYKKMTGNN